MEQHLCRSYRKVFNACYFRSPTLTIVKHVQELASAVTGYSSSKFAIDILSEFAKQFGNVVVTILIVIVQVLLEHIDTIFITGVVVCHHRYTFSDYRHHDVAFNLDLLEIDLVVWRIRVVVCACGIVITVHNLCYYLRLSPLNSIKLNISLHLSAT